MNFEMMSSGAEMTRKIAFSLAGVLKRGSVLTLDGDLGAGKTTFAQGLAAGLGIASTVNSPTFNILKCYFDGKIPFYHIDAYRLEDRINDRIGLEEVIEGDGICAIEWACFISDMVIDPLRIRIEMKDDATRKISFSSDGEKYEEVFSVLKEIR